MGIAAAPAITALMLGAADPTPTPSSTPTATPSEPIPSPSPTGVVPGQLQVTKTDPSGNTVQQAGAAFDVLQDSTSGPLRAQLTTDATGTARAGLEPGTYCLNETAAPPGYQLMPSYNPKQCVQVMSGALTTVSVADPPAPTPSPSASPSPTPTPTPSPTAGPTGELQIVKTDAAGHTVTSPGFAFDLHVDSASGRVVAAVTTDTTGIAIAAALTPATYCLEETAAPDGFEVTPTYTPGACVTVPADPTKGSNPTRVTVADPASPSPPASGAASGAAGAPPSANHLAGSGSGPPLAIRPGLDSFAIALVAVGALLVISGLVMIAVDVNRRRRLGVEIR